MKGEYSLRKQITTKRGTPRGVVSSAKLSIELLQNNEGLQISNPFSDEYSAIEFGIRYFYYVYHKEYKTGMQVYIEDIGLGHSIDSSPVSIAFVIIKAMCNALKFEIEGLEIIDGAIVGFPH